MSLFLSSRIPALSINWRLCSDNAKKAMFPWLQHRMQLMSFLIFKRMKIARDVVIFILSNVRNHPWLANVWMFYIWIKCGLSMFWGYCTFLGFPGCPVAAAARETRTRSSALGLYRTLMTGSISKAWNWKIRDNIFAIVRLIRRSRRGGSEGRSLILVDSCRHPVDIDPDERHGGMRE